MTTPEKREQWEREFKEWASEHCALHVVGDERIEIYLAACEKRDAEFERETDNLYRQSCYEDKEWRRHLRNLDDSHKHTIRELKTAMREAIAAMRPCQATAEAHGILAEALDYKTKLGDE